MLLGVENFALEQSIKGEARAPFKEESCFGVCAHCVRNYFIKRLKTGNNIRYTLTCSANKATLTCRESESGFVEDLKDIILVQINVNKGDTISFKKELKKAFILDTKMEEAQQFIKNMLKIFVCF